MSSDGDLGLGYGLKPGALVSLLKPHSGNNIDSELNNFDQLLPTRDSHLINSRLSSKLPTMRRSRSEDSYSPHSNRIVHSYSSSQSNNICNTDVPSNETKNKNPSPSKNVIPDLQQKDCKQEVELLKSELDLCQRQLEAKYRAVRVLQKQAFIAQSQQFDSNERANKIVSKLEQEIAQIKFEQQHNQSTIMQNQETWAQRFDKVCRENSSLRDELESKIKESQRMLADKMALQRERDELLSHLDVQERQKYESLRSLSASHCDDAYNSFSSAELAVLGACNCRAMKPEPCGCAIAAARLKRSVENLRTQMASQQQQKEESLMCMDAYRIAFEDQLNRNHRLIRHIAELSIVDQPKSSKFKAAVRWLIKEFNEDSKIQHPAFIHDSEDLSYLNIVKVSADINKNKDDEPDELTINASPDTSSSNTASDSTDSASDSTNPEGKLQTKQLSESTANNNKQLGSVSTDLVHSDSFNELLNDPHQNENEKSLLRVLLDLINDRAETAAHQKIAARILAKKTQVLEKKLHYITDNENVVQKSYS